MNRRSLAGAVALLLVVVALITTSSGVRDTSSSLSRGGSGWSALRRFLENRGAATRTLDRLDIEDLADAGVVVVSGTPARQSSDDEFGALQRFLTDGGRVIYGYGPTARVLSRGKTLGVRLDRSLKTGESLNPFTWRREALRTEHLEGTPDGPTIALKRQAFHVVTEPGDQVLLRSSEGAALIVLRPLGRGEMLIAPVQALSNGFLHEAGNAALLESVFRRFHRAGLDWAFDEYHHGLVRGLSPVGRRAQAALDLFLAQVVIAYAAFAFALARRFGPAWVEPRTASGAASTFLMKVAAIHDGLGHHREAERRLVERAREVFGIDVPKSGQTLTASAALLATAQRIHDLQTERRTA